MRNDTEEAVEIAIPTLLQKETFRSSRSEAAHVPLTSPRSYYRSKFIPAAVGINALLVAANTLVVFIAHVQDFSSCLNSEKLYQYLLHEIKAFEVAAQKKYRPEIVLMARYILCCALDEAILTHASVLQDDWAQHTLLATFHHEDQGNERFFVILERLKVDPVSHTDFLELIYVCLKLGYQGKFRSLDHDGAELDAMIESLYETIDWQRGDVKKMLLGAEAPTSKRIKSRFTRTLLIIVLTAVLLLLVYGLFDFLLSYSAAPLYQQLNGI